MKRTFTLFAFVVAFIQTSMATNITWTNGSTDGKWETATNWNSGTVPGINDVVIFNNTSANNCTILSNVSVAGIEIQAGYTGVITQSNGFTITVGGNNFTQAGGAFVGGNSTIDINGSLIISAGSFTSTTGELQLKNDFTLSGGSFIHNNGTSYI